MRPAATLVLAAGLALLPGVAAATCPPPAAGGGSWLERLAAARAGTRGPVSDREMLDFFARENIPPVTVWPVSGPAPLEVKIGFLYVPERTAKVEFSPDGSASQPWQVDLVSPASRTHAFARPGRYDVTVWVHDAGGRVQRFATPVEVLTAAAFDAELQARWDTLKARLRAQDVAGALDCIAARRRERYREIFTEVIVNQRGRVDDILTTIRPVTTYPGIAVYEMTRTEDGKALSYDVRFYLDGDGVWRVSQF